MPKKRYRPEEIISKLREADVLISQGKKVIEVIKALDVTDVPYYRWLIRRLVGASGILGLSVPEEPKNSYAPTEGGFFTA
jgi:hypothetical protein